MEFLSIGCSTVKDNYSGVYSRRDLLDVLRNYRKMDVRHIEFSHLVNMSERDAIEICNYAQNIGVIPWSVHTRGLSNLSAEMVAQFETEAKLAQLLGAKILVMHPMKNKDGEAEMDCFETAADIARQYGRVLAFETGFSFPYLELIDLIDTMNRPDVGINIDMGHSYLRDCKQVEAVVRAVGHRLVTIHAQDNFGERDDHQMPGLGLINWLEVLRALRESPYNGPLMMEMTDGGKDRRTVPQVRNMTIEQEIVCASSWLKWLWSTI